MSELAELDLVTRQVSLRVRPVQSFSELCSSFSLVYRNYVNLGYMRENEFGMRFGLHQLIPSYRTWLVERDNEILGTGGLVIDSEFGLPLQECFPEQYQALVSQGLRIAEGTMFGSPERNECILVPLFSEILRCLRNEGVDMICVVVNPRHRGFWTKVLGFEIIADTSACTHVNGAPGILLGAYLEKLETSEALGMRMLKQVLAEAPQKSVSGGRYVLELDELLALLEVNTELRESLGDDTISALRNHLSKSGQTSQDTADSESTLVPLAA